MGLLSFFKKPKKNFEDSKFNFPEEGDLDMPPPPPALEPEEAPMKGTDDSMDKDFGFDDVGGDITDMDTSSTDYGKDSSFYQLGNQEGEKEDMPDFSVGDDYKGSMDSSNVAWGSNIGTNWKVGERNIASESKQIPAQNRETNQDFSELDAYAREESLAQNTLSNFEPQVYQDNDNLRTNLTIPGVKFVIIDDFKAALATIADINSSLSNLNHSISEVSHKRQDEEALFNSWHSQANDILRKLTYVDNTLFEKNRWS